MIHKNTNSSYEKKIPMFKYGQELLHCPFLDNMMCYGVLGDSWWPVFNNKQNVFVDTIDLILVFASNYLTNNS